jgi:hypothetical protein
MLKSSNKTLFFSIVGFEGATAVLISQKQIKTIIIKNTARESSVAKKILKKDFIKINIYKK